MSFTQKRAAKEMERGEKISATKQRKIEAKNLQRTNATKARLAKLKANECTSSKKENRPPIEEQKNGLNFQNKLNLNSKSAKEWFLRGQKEAGTQSDFGQPTLRKI